MDYSIIIPAYNEENYLPTTLAAVKTAMAANPQYQGEIIVIDNDSTDQTAAIATQWGATIVSETEHQIAKVRNAGAKIAQGKYLIFLDADTLITNEILQISLNNLSQDEYIGGGFSLAPIEEITRSEKILFLIWNTYSRFFSISPGGYLYCKKIYFDQIGGFNEAYFAAEEIILSKELKKLAKQLDKKFKITKPFVFTSMRKRARMNINLSLFIELIQALINQERFKDKKNCKYWY